jgi:3',5'-nucleoside bisphosphate phosphatase
MLPNETDEHQQYVDLHIHSNHSDGACSVDEILQLAAERGLSAIAITDHDCVDSYPYALQRGAECGIEVIPGVEISSNIGRADIHILAYHVDWNNPTLRARLQEMKQARYVRAERIVSNLNRLGIDLRFETVLKVAGNAAIGRPHIATAMLQEELIYSFREAFDRCIGYDSPAYVEKMQIAPAEVFRLILDAGGVPVLAHPAITRVDECIPQFVRDGLMGIEVIHSEASAVTERFYREIAAKHGLLLTGGSDFHSLTRHGRGELGYPRVPLAYAQALRGERTQAGSQV